MENTPFRLGKGVLVSSAIPTNRTGGEAKVIPDAYHALSKKKLWHFLKMCDIPFEQYKETHEEYHLEMYDLNNFLWFLSLMDYEYALKLFCLSYYSNVLEEPFEALVCDCSPMRYEQKLSESERKLCRYYRIRLGFDLSWFETEEECITAFLGYICKDVPNSVKKNWVGPMRVKMRKENPVLKKIIDCVGAIYAHER